MSTIQLTTPNGDIDAYLATPAAAGPRPGVVVLHDGMGMSADVRATADRLADNGYLAVAPNLFARGVKCVPAVLRELLANRDGVTVADILAARAHLAADPNCTGRIAVVGFCLGGGFALLVAPKGFDAAAPFYPSGRGNYADFLRGSCPVVASYGALDPANPRRGPKLERVLSDYGVEHDVKTYPGVTHAFANVPPPNPSCGSPAWATTRRPPRTPGAVSSPSSRPIWADPLACSAVREFACRGASPVPRRVEFALPRGECAAGPGGFGAQRQPRRARVMIARQSAQAAARTANMAG